VLRDYFVVAAAVFSLIFTAMVILVNLSTNRLQRKMLSQQEQVNRIVTNLSERVHRLETRNSPRKEESSVK
jgi:hypothetical protein